MNSTPCWKCQWSIMAMATSKDSQSYEKSRAALVQHLRAEHGLSAEQINERIEELNRMVVR